MSDQVLTLPLLPSRTLPELAPQMVTSFQRKCLPVLWAGCVVARSGPSLIPQTCLPSPPTSAAKAAITLSLSPKKGRIAAPVPWLR